MGSKHNTCDYLFVSIYMLIAQLMHIMASNPNKYKDQSLGGWKAWEMLHFYLFIDILK